MKATRIVVATRGKHYPYRLAANRLVRTDRAGKRKVTLVNDPGGTGQEIARGVVACLACAEQF